MIARDLWADNGGFSSPCQLPRAASAVALTRSTSGGQELRSCELDQRLLACLRRHGRTRRSQPHSCRARGGMPAHSPFVEHEELTAESYDSRVTSAGGAAPPDQRAALLAVNDCFKRHLET